MVFTGAALTVWFAQQVNLTFLMALGNYCYYDTYWSVPAGSYNYFGMDTYWACPAYYYCATTSALPVKCPQGTYSDGSRTSCLACPIGQYCVGGSHSGCASGYQQTGTSQEYCSICPYNAYCSNTAYIYDCSNTQYTDSGATGCSGVSSTMYTAGGTSTHQKYRYCPSGFYLDSSYTTCTLASVGYYGSGTYSQSLCDNYYVSSGSSSSCQYTPTAMVTTNSARAVTDLYICQAGQYYYNIVTCYSCPNGYYCPDPTASYTYCPAGTYQGTGMMFCYNCPPNSYCTGGTANAGMPGGYKWSTPYQYLNSFNIFLGVTHLVQQDTIAQQDISLCHALQELGLTDMIQLALDVVLDIIQLAHRAQDVVAIHGLQEEKQLAIT